MNKQVLTSVLITSIILSGCTSVFDVTYNKETKETLINLKGKEFILKNSSEISNKNFNANPFQSQSGQKIQTYRSEDKICSNMSFNTLPVLGMRMYYLTTAKEDIDNHYKDSCTSEKIDGLEYHKCPTINIISETKYGYGGVNSKKFLHLDRTECLEKIKSFVKSK